MSTIVSLVALSMVPTFLGCSSNPTIEDVVGRFGNPTKIEQNEPQTEQSFTFNREAYILRVNADLKNKVTSMEAFGINKSVSYMGIRLGSQFKDVINNLGGPSSYVFGEKFVEVQYDGHSFRCQKINQKKSYEVTSIVVKFPYKKL